ncbi:MAG: class I SAM-dependent methyltransferase [Gemmataceae bacterium]
MQTEWKTATFQFWQDSHLYRDYGHDHALDQSPHRLELPRLLKECQNVLDLACGDGENLPFVPSGVTYTGCDCSPAALDRLMARSDHPALNKTAHPCDISQLPLPDASQDALISSFAFEHFLEVPKILAECDRVLRPGGLIVLFGPDFSFPNNYGPPQGPWLEQSKRRLYWYALQRLARKWISTLRGHCALFEYVEPLPLDDGTYVPDADMTHLTSHKTIANYMRRKAGYECLELVPTRNHRSWLRRCLSSLGLWGEHGDTRLVLRKPMVPPRHQHVTVRECCIFRQNTNS